MPPTETPQNPAASPLPSPPPEADAPTPPEKIRTSRFGELDHTELVHLLDSLQDDRSKSRLRESFYISIIFYLALAWLVIYGPRVLFHQGRIVPITDLQKQREKMTQLQLNDMAKLKTPKLARPGPPPVRPTLDRRTMEQLQAMRRAQEASRPAPQVQAQTPPQPLPPAPQPQAAPPPPQQQAQVQPPLPMPQPRPAAPQPAQVPDAPRPNFSTPSSPGQSIAEAARAAARQHGQSGSSIDGGGGGNRGGGSGRAAANTGAEILSDTQGVDFGPYIRRLLRILRASWEPLIPEETRPPLNKEGSTLIRFTLQPNGTVSFMHLDSSTRDVAIDKAAWNSINAVGQFPPLPPEFKGPNLDLRINFIISHNRSDAE